MTAPRSQAAPTSSVTASRPVPARPGDLATGAPARTPRRARAARAREPRTGSRAASGSSSRDATRRRRDAAASSSARSSRAISQSASVARGYASGSSTRIDEYASAGTAAAAGSVAERVPARHDHASQPVRGEHRRGHREDEHELGRRVRRWPSRATTGASTYATSVARPYGSPRRAGSPVSAIARASWVSSSSSVKIVGTGCREACHAYSAASPKYTTRSGSADWKRARKSGRARRPASPTVLTGRRPRPARAWRTRRGDGRSGTGRRPLSAARMTASSRSCAARGSSRAPRRLACSRWRDRSRPGCRRR